MTEHQELQLLFTSMQQIVQAVQSMLSDEDRDVMQSLSTVWYYHDIQDVIQYIIQQCRATDTVREQHQVAHSDATTDLIPLTDTFSEKLIENQAFTYNEDLPPPKAKSYPMEKYQNFDMYTMFLFSTL